ncbi:response regulator transcription factor [Cellulosilyticum sp. I15G10I2]|uniref:response regulator transcription factor n=1 Tax=Cellulosilyticum sp. I15G10I2 TaxID=1892843 RepID=UPI00085BFA95|nr:response regulator [Cellulosilyticum sp. I15G10I2]
MYTYIVVDDEPLTRRGTIKKIGSLNDTVKCIGEASNGQEALSLIETLNPNIIITDMNMPILDGIGLLQQLNEKYTDKQIIVISGYKDFEYAKQAIAAKAISYILKPFNRNAIQDAIKHAINLIENKTELENKIVSIEAEKEFAKYDYDLHILKNLILGYHTTSPELVSDKLKLLDQNHHFILLTLHAVKKFDETLLTDLIQSQGFGDLSLYLSHLHNDKIGFFVLFFPENTPLNLNTLYQQIASDFINLLKHDDQNISIGISTAKSELIQLNSAFKETVAALNSKKLIQENTYYLFTVENMPVTPLHWKNLQEFLFRIETGETERVIALVEDLFNYFMMQPQCTLYDLKYYCIEITQKIRELLNLYFDNVAQGNTSSSVQSIFNGMFTFEEIKAYFLQFFTNISLSMQSKSIYACQDTIENVKTYVKRNYFNDLTSDFISSLFYMNRSYFSHLFKKKSGQNFVDYINTVRTEEAKRLLRDSDKKMYQVAKAVGYDNVKYFFRIFKKVTGITPEQYRKT